MTHPRNQSSEPTLDCNELPNQDLVMEIIRLSQEIDKVKAQRDMLQSELLKIHRRDGVAK